MDTLRFITCGSVDDGKSTLIGRLLYETKLIFEDQLEALKADLRKLKTSGAQVRLDVGAFKERYGVTRKFAIPLLEYLDRERVTRRVGESRVLV